MRIHARAIKDEPILVDRAANYFGASGQVFSIRAKIRSNGILTLTDTKLIFEQSDSDAYFEIPIREISRLGMGRWHEGLATFIPVLKVTYQGNLVFGVHVANPERWIEAIEAAAARQNLPSLLGPEKPARVRTKPARIVIVGAVAMVIVSLVLLIANAAINTFLREPIPPVSEGEVAP